VSCKSNIGYSTITYIDKDGNQKELSIQPSNNEEYVSEVIYAINSISPEIYDYYVIGNIYCDANATIMRADNSMDNVNFQYSAIEQLIFNSNTDILHSDSYFTYAVSNINNPSINNRVYNTTTFYRYPEITYLFMNNELIKTQISDDILNSNIFYNIGISKIFNNLSANDIKNNNIYVSDTTKTTFEIHYEIKVTDKEKIHYFFTFNASSGLVTNIFINYTNYTSNKMKELLTNENSTITDIQVLETIIQFEVLYDRVPNMELTDEQKAQYK
jgi:hypothetical protein